jgi:hypothetical protein
MWKKIKAAMGVFAKQMETAMEQFFDNFKNKK